MTYQRYLQYLCSVPAVELTLDISRMHFDEGWLDSMEPRIQSAFAAMAELEAGAIANPDENRMVGHYWLRNAELAPRADLRDEINRTLAAISSFVSKVHAEGHFTDVLSIGIGGSALGPMFVADALGHPLSDRMRMHFFDNTDPDGIERVLAGLSSRLASTLVLVISKSGGTPETANGMKLAQAAFSRAGLSFAPNAVAITMPGSKLDKTAQAEGWLARIPMLDWVGGRTSVLSAVGLLPAALQGLDIDALLAGAAAMDQQTRSRRTAQNPAALLALMWHKATRGCGTRDMVVLPYKDRLLLFSRYLQQLIMESLGKQYDLEGNRVDQGLSVYGNKGSTDQHAYVQQLRDGINNFFVTFVRVLEDGGDALELAPGVRTGDYLDGFLLGTREALSGNGRESITLTIQRVDARSVGALIALFERAVGLYATLIGINAYHQPGVEAGKRAASVVLKVQSALLASLRPQPEHLEALVETAQAILDAEIGPEEDRIIVKPETALLILEHLAANRRLRCDQSGYFIDRQ